MKRASTTHQHAGALAVDLNSALEQGLGVHTTKIGTDNKELAYAMPQSRAKWFALGILTSLVLLAIMAITFAELFNDERLMRTLELRNSMLRMGDQKMESVRLGMALHQQHAVREHQEEDVMRAFNRIQNVLAKRFEDFISKQRDNANLQLELQSFRNELQEFVQGEITNIQSQIRTIDAESQATLENLAKLQEQSLRDLLRNVNGVKMEAFEDMLQDVFAAGERAVEVDISPVELQQLEALADGLYEEKLTLDDARSEFARIRRDKKWPTNALDAARAEVEFAQALEQLADDGKLAKGKKEIALIAKQWQAAVELAREGKEDEEEEEDNEDEEDEEDEEDFDEEIKANVDALLAIHKLVAQGKVPFHLLDFDAIDMKDLQYQEDEEEDEGEGEEQDASNPSGQEPEKRMYRALDVNAALKEDVSESERSGNTIS